MHPLTSVVESESVNAAVSWILVGFLGVATVESALDGALLWAGLAAVTLVVTLVPAAVVRDPRVMVSWEGVLLATVPLLGRSLGLVTEVATYVAVAALALLVAVEIHTFSEAEMTARFAVGFVVVTTMAIAGVWAIAQFASDWFLGTTFVAGTADLMWELVLATVVGLVAGVLFELYFRQFERSGSTPARLQRGDAG